MSILLIGPMVKFAHCQQYKYWVLVLLAMGRFYYGKINILQRWGKTYVYTYT